MKIFLKVLNIFFVVLGVIFLFFLIGVAYFWIADPLNLKVYIPQGVSPTAVIKTVTGTNEIKIDNVDKHPLLNEQQEAELEAIGIEPADLPTEITPQMEQCFVKVLGDQRANQIAEGNSPTSIDLLKVSSCF